jgi:hypothetical protein
LGATARVVGVIVNSRYMAYPFSVVEEVGALNDTVADVPIVVLHKAGVASVLDAAVIAEGRDIGGIAVFERTLGNRVLTFAALADGTYQDEETGSTWNILGEATAGELMGSQLTQRVAFDHFWFAWVAFFPQTELYNTNQN